MSETSPSAKLVKTKPAVKVTKVETPAASPAADAAETPKATKQVLKTKAKAEQPAAKTVEKVESTTDANDLIVQVAFEVENLTDKKAFELVPTLQNNIDHDFFKLGGVLAKIQADGWYMERGYENFRGFVEAESGLEYRKALYFIGIYNNLVQSGVKWEQVKHLGWTKLKELAAILTPENVEEWAGLAENMTVLQLQAYIKEQKAKVTPAADGPTTDDDAKKVTTMTFKLHTDQKATVREALDKCKAETGTEFDSVALEHICLDYLSGDSALKKMPTLAQLMKGKSAEEVLEAFSTVFPNVEITANITE